MLIPAHHQRGRKRERRRCDCYSNPPGSLMGKSEWEWRIRGLWRPIYSVISQLTFSAMAGLPESSLKIWQGLNMTDRLHGAGEEGARRMQVGKKWREREGQCSRNWRKTFFHSWSCHLTGRLRILHRTWVLLYELQHFFYSHIDWLKIPKIAWRSRDDWTLNHWSHCVWERYNSQSEPNPPFLKSHHI